MPMGLEGVVVGGEMVFILCIFSVRLLIENVGSVAGSSGSLSRPARD